MTAEKVAEQYGVTREEQDAFALESQRRAAAAIRDGIFADEIVPVEVPRKGAAPLLVTADEHPRPDLSRRVAGRAAAGLRRRRDGDRRQFERDQRRRVRAAAGGGRNRHGWAGRWPALWRRPWRVSTRR